MNRNLKRTCVAHIQRLLICTCIFTLFATIGKASHVQENTETGNYILILNSYNESSPWSNSITTPIVHKIAGIENMDAYIEHLNLFMVGDSTKSRDSQKFFPRNMVPPLPACWYSSGA